MSYVSIIEQVFDEFEAFIWANLPTVIALYNAAQTDLTLVMPKEKYRGDYQIDQLKLYPGLLIKPSTIQKNPSGVDRPLVKDVLIFDLSLWIVVAGSSVEQMQKLCERYAWALNEIIDSEKYQPAQNQTAILNSIRAVTGFDWHALAQNGNGQLLSAGFVDCEILIQHERAR